MFRIFRKSNKKAFTVAELAVAAGIFVLFAGAVFSLYRMGSRMFVSGSWKYQRQKEAERFFEVLKERVEQASTVCKIENGQLISAPFTNFGTLSNNTNINATSGGDNQQIAGFVVAKPNISSIQNGRTGIVLFHSIFLKKDPVSNLYNLRLRVQRDTVAASDGVNYFNGNFDIVDFNNNVPLSDFNESPNNYSLGPVPHTYEVKDVSAVTISLKSGEVLNADSNNLTATSTIRPTMYGLTVEMQNPKHSNTKLVMNFSAKVDGSLGINEH